MACSLEMRRLWRAVSGNIGWLFFCYQWDERVSQSFSGCPLLGGHQLDDGNGGGSSNYRGGIVSLESALEGAGGV